MMRCKMNEYMLEGAKRLRWGMGYGWCGSNAEMQCGCGEINMMILAHDTPHLAWTFPMKNNDFKALWSAWQLSLTLHKQSLTFNPASQFCGSNQISHENRLKIRPTEQRRK